MSVDLIVPDIGNFTDVAVVEVLVKPGDVVELETPLVTIETDKASMDVPAAAAGRVTEVLLKVGDKVSKGSLIARLEASAGAARAPATPAAEAPAAPAAAAPPVAVPESAGDTVRMPAAEAGRGERAQESFSRSAQLLVLGSGPGGYTAAFRGADLGLDTVLIERYAALGGVQQRLGGDAADVEAHAPE